MKRLVVIVLGVTLLLGSATGVFAARRHPPSKGRSVKVSRTVGFHRSQGGSRAGAKARPAASASIRNDGSKAQAGAGSRSTTSGRAGSSQTGSKGANDRSSEGSGSTITRNGLSGGSVSVRANNRSSTLKKYLPKL